MPQITARDANAVRKWVTETPHHIGFHEHSKTGKFFLVLTDGKGGNRLRIPELILKEADLVPGDPDNRYMFLPRGHALAAGNQLPG